MQLSKEEYARKSFGLVWFLFYGPSTHFRSFRARSVNLATLFASLLGSLPVLSAHFFASNWQLLFLNQRKRENGRRNVFMTKSPRKNVPDVGIELGAACMPSELASDRATAPGLQEKESIMVLRCKLKIPSIGKPLEAEQLPSRRNFQSAPRIY